MKRDRRATGKRNKWIDKILQLGSLKREIIDLNTQLRVLLSNFQVRTSRSLLLTNDNDLNPDNERVDDKANFLNP
jgi:hypothetical protein